MLLCAQVFAFVFLWLSCYIQWFFMKHSSLARIYCCFASEVRCSLLSHLEHSLEMFASPSMLDGQTSCISSIELCCLLLQPASNIFIRIIFYCIVEMMANPYLVLLLFLRHAFNKGLHCYCFCWNRRWKKVPKLETFLVHVAKIR
jgi:hypothetical protein